MANKHPYEELMDQIAELMRFALECSKREPSAKELPFDLEERLSKLEKDVARFKMMGEAMIDDLGFNPKEIVDKVNEGEMKNLPEQEQAFFDRLQRLKEQAVAASEGVTEQTQPKKREPKQRKTKFKRHGIDSKWKPL